jgi:hypothetical protein
LPEDKPRYVMVRFNTQQHAFWCVLRNKVNISWSAHVKLNIVFCPHMIQSCCWHCSSYAGCWLSTWYCSMQCFGCRYVWLCLSNTHCSLWDCTCAWGRKIISCLMGLWNSS